MISIKQKEKLSKILDDDINEFTFNGLEIIGKITSIYDADTCKICFYFGKKIIKINCRLLGIDSPEIKPSLSNKNRKLEKKASKISRNRFVELVSDCDIDIKTMYKKKIYQIF